MCYMNCTNSELWIKLVGNDRQKQRETRRFQWQWINTASEIHTTIGFTDSDILRFTERELEERSIHTNKESFCDSNRITDGNHRLWHCEFTQKTLQTLLLKLCLIKEWKFSVVRGKQEWKLIENSWWVCWNRGSWI